MLRSVTILIPEITSIGKADSDLFYLKNFIDKLLMNTAQSMQ